MVKVSGQMEGSVARTTRTSVMPTIVVAMSRLCSTAYLPTRFPVDILFSLSVDAVRGYIAAYKNRTVGEIQPNMHFVSCGGVLFR